VGTKAIKNEIIDCDGQTYYSQTVTGTMIFFLLNDFPASGSSLCAAACSIILSAALDAPIKDIIVLIALADKEISEELAEIGIIGLVIKAKGSSVVQKDTELIGKTTAKEVSGRGHLFFHDAVIFLFLGSGFQTLPGEGTTEEVHKNISEGLEVVPTGLLYAKMGVDRGVTSSTSEILVLSVWDMEVGLRVTEFLCQAKINDVDLVAPLSDAHQKVVGFDVTMDEVARVDIFDAGNLWGRLVMELETRKGAARYQLVSQEQDSLETEFAVAKVEEVLEGGPEQIKDHGIVVAFGTVPANKRHTDTASEGLVDLGLVLELGMLSLD
jgi:hypothetical protein